MRRIALFAGLAVGLGLSGVGLGVGAAGIVSASPDPSTHQQLQLLGRSVLRAVTYRPGSPPSGAFFAPSDIANANGNGIATPLPGQAVQGISALVPAGNGTWWALPDNGYGVRENSADWQLAIYRIDPRFGQAGGPQLVETVLLSDPSRKVSWKTVCDPTTGTDLPPFSFNTLPATPPPACGTDPSARLLTGFDFDPESIEVGRDGTFWIGEEFGPFLLHADRQGRLLEAPIPVPGAKSPQNPTLDVLHGERPTVAQSRGLESLAISPDRGRLYPMLEGALANDDPQDLRIFSFDIQQRQFLGQIGKLRMEMPGAKVNLSTLKLKDGSAAYPGTTPPTGTGGESVAEMTSVNANQFLIVERDGNGDGLAAPREKKVYLLDRRGPEARDGYLAKHALADLLAIPDPKHLVSPAVDFFQMPFVTIESVHVVDSSTIIVVDDNNFPFSNGRSRSETNARTGPLRPDDNEFVEIGLGTHLKVDHRLLMPPQS
jgi:hypothetical protein